MNRFRASVTPYSSVVGGGITLKEEGGSRVFLVLFAGTSQGITKEETVRLSHEIEALINNHGLLLPDRE